MLKQKILPRKYRNIFSVLVRFFLLYFLKKLYIMHTPGKVKFWQSRGQRFDPAILHQGKPWNHNGFEVFSYIRQIAQSRFCVEFMLNARKNCSYLSFPCHAFLQLFLYFYNFYILHKRIDRKRFFSPIRKSTVKKMYFSVHFIFPALVLNFVLNHKFFAIIFKDRDIGCPRSTS